MPPATLLGPGRYQFPIRPGGTVSDETLYGNILHDGAVHLDYPPNGPAADAELQQPTLTLDASRPLLSVFTTDANLRAPFADVDLSGATVTKSFGQTGGSYSISGATLKISAEAVTLLGFRGCNEFSGGETIGTGDSQGQGRIDPPPAPKGSCGGRVATITGGNASETIRGTPGADVIDAGAGNDTIRGLGGADLVCGGSGSDNAAGGSGADRLFGQAGKDRLSGDAGKDSVDGGAGNDRLSGGAGADRLKGGRGSDRMNGGPGRDRLEGGPGADRLSGGPGRDALVGGPGKNRIRQ